MNLSFDRLESQTLYEEFLGCFDPKDFGKYNSQAKEIPLSHYIAKKLNEILQHEASLFAEKGLNSLLTAFVELEQGLESWPIVKLYYSVFYFLRAEFCLMNIAMIRMNDLKYIEAKSGATLLNIRLKHGRGDHEAAIKLAEKLMKDTDLLLSQSIDERNCYLWLKEQREAYQYRSNRYIEYTENVGCFDFTHWQFEDQLETILSFEGSIYCFLEEYAALAIPVKRAQLTMKKLLQVSSMSEKSSRILRSNIVRSDLAISVLERLLTP